MIEDLICTYNSPFKPRPTFFFTRQYKHIYLQILNGGKFEYDGSNLIPVGALKNYEGPCPMTSMNPRYEIRVKAIDENGKVIAFGKKFKKYPPEPE